MLKAPLCGFFDGWTNFNSPGNAALSDILLFLLYLGPGMFKTVLTLRTGNAWGPRVGLPRTRPTRAPRHSPDGEGLPHHLSRKMQGTVLNSPAPMPAW